MGYGVGGRLDGSDSFKRFRIGEQSICGFFEKNDGEFFLRIFVTFLKGLFFFHQFKKLKKCETKFLTVKSVEPGISV